MDVALEAELARMLDGGDTRGAATLALRRYGPQLLGYLRVVLRDEGRAADAFSAFSEDLWVGLPSFRRACSVRTFAYKLAWHAALRVARDPYARRATRLDTADASRLADEVRASTAPILRSDVKDRVAALRAALTPEEQTLLALRVDRDLSWAEVAEVFDLDEATLRKRFERTKEHLRRLAVESGLLSE